MQKSSRGMIHVRRAPLLSLLFLALVWVPAQAEIQRPTHPSVGYATVRVQGVLLRVVTVDLSGSVEVRPVLAPSGQERDFATLTTGRKAPLAAINGTFFDTRSRVVVGNVVWDGKLLQEGVAGSAFTIDRSGLASLQQRNSSLGRHQDWNDYQMAVSGIGLLKDGELAVDLRSEGFGDPGLFGPRQRSALGVTKNKKLLMVSTGEAVSVHQMARLMRGLGAVDALALDGGSSTGLAYAGRVVIAPKRKLTNVLAVYRRGEAPAPVNESLLARRALQHYQRGAQLMGWGDLVRAHSQFRLAVSKGPEQARYWSALGAAAQGLGRHDEAAQAYLNASRLYLNHWKPEEARRLAEKASRAAPRRTDVLLVLGASAWQAGQRGQARQALESVVAAHPGHPQATALLRKIKSSGG